jgi:organic hydroperoxide reductase OsmC/OhrA
LTAVNGRAGGRVHDGRMRAYPHHYLVHAGGAAAGPVEVRGSATPALETWPPPEFDGPSGHWSPETLLVASVADCFILTFRAVARMAKLEWERLDVDVTGTLERIEGVTRFTRFVVVPRLAIVNADDHERAVALLEKAERGCLVSNSLKAEFTVEAQVATATP